MQINQALVDSHLPAVEGVGTWFEVFGFRVQFCGLKAWGSEFRGGIGRSEEVPPHQTFAEEKVKQIYGKRDLCRLAFRLLEFFRVANQA